jgi:two-component system, chemotaxis family, CheB/CheR fusion protein
LLIHVTRFFLDPESFEALKQQALLPLLRTLDVDTVFRAWVPGCATGEEAISIAILIYECLQELDMLRMEVRIFATDADTTVIQRARSEFYPKSIAEDITEDRLREHFIEEENGYRVRSHIQRMIL